MPVLRQGAAQRAQNVDLAGRVIDMVVAANDVGDLHVPVVDHNTEVVGGGAVGACYDQIVQFAVVETDRPLDHVVPGRDAVGGVAKAHDRFAAFRYGRQGFARLGAPGAVVAWLQAQCTGLFTHGFYFVGAAVAIIGMALFQQLRNNLAIAIHALHLVERAFIGRQPQPVHAVKNGLNSFRGGAFKVGVFDAQHEHALVMAGKGPGKKRRAGSTQMQITGGRGRKAGSYNRSRSGHCDRQGLTCKRQTRKRSGLQ